MISQDFIKAIQILTIKNVEDQTFTQWYNFICRWYSREFSTPLAEVMDMPEETVITVYLEDNLYSQYNSTEGDGEHVWAELKHKVLMTEEDRVAVEESDDAFMAALDKEDSKINDKEKTEVKSKTKAKPPAEDPNLMREESFYISGEDVDQLSDFIGK